MFFFGALVSVFDSNTSNGLNKGFAVLPNYLYWTLLCILLINIYKNIELYFVVPYVFIGLLISSFYFYIFPSLPKIPGFLNPITANSYSFLAICFTAPCSVYLLKKKGKIVTYGNLSQIFLEKEFTNVFGKFESSSILEGIIFEKNAYLNITKILISGFEIVLPGDFKKIGEKIRVRIRARDILISKNINSDSITENQLFGNVEKIKGEDDTAFSELLIKIGNSQDFQFLLIRITKYQLEKLKVKKDDKIYILFKSTSFDRQAII